MRGSSPRGRVSNQFRSLTYPTFGPPFIAVTSATASTTTVAPAATTPHTSATEYNNKFSKPSSGGLSLIHI